LFIGYDEWIETGIDVVDVTHISISVTDVDAGGQFAS